MDSTETNKVPDSFSMSNDFDIVEHFSDDDEDSSKTDLPSPTYDPCGFPKAKHRSLLNLSLSKPQEYDNSLLKPLEEMTLDEIKDAQNYLYEKLGKDMCDFIKERKLKRMEQSQNMEIKKETQQESKSGNHVEKSNELIFKFDRKEFLKYQWMNPSESNKAESSDQSPGKLNLHELRFDFEGRLLDYSEHTDKSYDTSLYNHGLDSDKPGYTFVELVHLLQSSFKPQVQISVRTLANVLFKSYMQFDNNKKSDNKDQYDSKEQSDNNKQYDRCFNSYDRCFFSYPQYRWKNYINNDLDLLSKVGYSVCENQLSLSILVDSLRCLSLLLFGDRCSWNNFDSLDTNGVVQVQDVLFDYYQFYMGVDMYYWNPLYLDLMETNMFGGSDSIFENESCNNNNNNNTNNNNNSSNNNNKDNRNNTNNNNNNSSSNVSLRLKRFYTKCLEGHYKSSSVEEIVKELFGVVEHKCNNNNINNKDNTNNNNRDDNNNKDNTNTDNNRDNEDNNNNMNCKKETDLELNFKMNSTLFLLSKNNIVYKLLLIMQRYKDNIKVQLYCTSSISGLVRYFGSPLANALTEFQLFKDHFEWLAEFLLVRNNQEKGLLHLENAFLHLVKCLSVYLDDLAGFFDTSSSVSVVKHALTQSFKKELKALNMISDVDFNTNEEESMISNRYAATALNCMTVWSLKEYLFDSLDEFVPVVNLMMFQMKELAKDKNKLNVFLQENSEKLSAFNLHFSSCVRLNEMHNHFEFNGVMRNVNELVNLFAAENLWSEVSGYYVYSLLQLQYDYVSSLYNSEFVGSDEKNEKEDEDNNKEEKEKRNKQNEGKKTNEEKMKKMNERLMDLEFLESSLVMILERVSDLFVTGDVEFPEELVLLAFFDQENFGGSYGCMYNESLVKSDFGKYVLPFNCLNLALNVLLKLKLVGNSESQVNYGSNLCDLSNSNGFSSKLKEKLFKLGEDMIKALKKVYFNLHDNKSFYLNCSVYLVKSLPVFESWLVYLRTLVDLGFDDPDAVFAILALSVDYRLIESTLDLLSSRFGLSGLESVFDCFEKFNKYVSGYSLGSDRLPLVSFLSFLTYLPLLTSLNYSCYFDSDVYLDVDLNCKKETDLELNLKMNSTLFLLSKLVSGTLSSKFLEWSFPRYLFSQLVYTVGSSELDNLFSEFTSEHYFVYRKMLFNRLSASCDLRVVESEDILDRWVDALDKFIPNDDYQGQTLSEYFRDKQEMTAYCGKLVEKFSSGQHDSPVTVGLIMLFTSYLSTEECSKTVWSDDCLMVLLGRNLSFDFETFEISHTYDSNLVCSFSVGNMFTFASPFNSTAIVRSQVKLLKSFSDDSARNRDPVLFLTVLSLWKNLGSEELESAISELRSNLVKELLNRLLKKDNK